MVEINCVSSKWSQLGESPFWDVQSQSLWWVDITEGMIYNHHPESKQTSEYNFNEVVGCVAVRKNGGLVVGARSGLWFFDPNSGERQKMHTPESHLPENCFNDATTDPTGRLWAGTMKRSSNPEPIGSFYRLDGDGTLTHWQDGFFTTNGLTFSPDGKTMYYSDSNPQVRTLWACDYDCATGTPSNARIFFDTNTVAGRPDGGTVDAEGCYWMAGVGGWQIYRISPEGKVLLTMDVPVERPTKTMFGGADLSTLYVTSMGNNNARDDARQPNAGSVFAITGLGIKGIPQARFAG